MMPLRRAHCLLLLIAALSLGCTEQEAALTSVDVQLKWYHQAQFAGFYTAVDEGIYADHGLDIRLHEGGSEIDPIQALTEGNAQFAVSSPEEVIVAAHRGKPIVAVAVVYQRNPMVFLVRQDSAIKTPLDFAGHRINFPVEQGELLFKTLAQRVGLSLADVEKRPYDYTYQALENGDVDITAGYITGGYLRAKQRGLKARVIWPDDYGVHFYGDVLATTREILEQRPELVKAFVSASLEGWQQALNAPERTLDSVMANARHADRSLQAAMLENTIPLVQVTDRPIGDLDPGKWQQIENALRTSGQLSDAPGSLPSYDLSSLEAFEIGSR